MSLVPLTGSASSDGRVLAVEDDLGVSASSEHPASMEDMIRLPMTGIKIFLLRKNLWNFMYSPVAKRYDVCDLVHVLKTIKDF